MGEWFYRSRGTRQGYPMSLRIFIWLWMKSGISVHGVRFSHLHTI